MALTACPECGKDISDTVKNCPHCGFDVQAEAKKKAKKSANKLFYITMAVIFSIVILAGMAPKRPYVAGSDTIGAVVYCQNYVKSQFKTPDTVKFPTISTNKITEHLGDDVYLVKSTVEAKNSFNANIRHDYSCKIKRRSEDFFELIDISVTER